MSVVKFRSKWVHFVSKCAQKCVEVYSFAGFVGFEMACQFLYATDIRFHFKFELHRAQPCWFSELCLEYESIETCGVSAASG